MKVLIVGSGAREHVIGEKISQSPRVSKIFFAPGNGGTIKLGENLDIDSGNIRGLLDFALEEGIDYTIVGPEDPLCAGIVDAFEEKGLMIFGPSKAAAQLEDSKSFAKEFMVRHKIPTAEYLETDELQEASDFCSSLIKNRGKAVIKADGLCAGKGVFIVSNEDEGKKYLEEIFIKGNYGRKKVVIEEFLDGFEISLIGFTDGKSIKLLPSSKDHKKILEGEKGSNTGGMGTYSPNIQAEPYLDEIEKLVVKPFLKGLKKDSLDYRGIIFIGLMIGSHGISVLEFNTRFGDPETQSILNRIENDLLDIMLATTKRQLSEIEIIPNQKKVITLVLASGGYPGQIETGYKISGLDQIDGVKVYHAGTRIKDGELQTSGGRVLSLVAIENSFEEGIKKVYKEADKVEFSGKYFRKDIGPMVKRIYVEEKTEYDSRITELRDSIIRDLGFHPGELRMFDRYDIDGLDQENLEKIIDSSLSNPQTNQVYYEESAFELESSLKKTLVVEYDLGQFNEKEEALISNIKLVSGLDSLVRSSVVYSFRDDLDEKRMKELEKYLINPVNQKKGRLIGVPTKLENGEEKEIYNHVFEGFRNLGSEDLKIFRQDAGLAMSMDDLRFVQDHYKELGRDINETELYILDTYWSDHCRHTTFNTILDISFQSPETKLDKRLKDEFQAYLEMRNYLNRKKPISLMDMGTILAKVLKKDGILTNVEESDEVNACSIEVDILIKDPKTLEEREERYLLMFKNETHNHPTEIEPFGGASTCLGGCIRDPLSGRSFVYQAMRITGAKDPRDDYKNTLEGKLAQRQIAIQASDGYSSYGNEIGLAGGLVEEIYHDRFVAKRMELGALVGAVPKENIIREKPIPGDIIILIGGKTGRDGVGGATGSSRVQTEDSIVEASAEVQRGNAPVERNIIRLFKKKEVTKMIKISNDFGAGGVSVAIGELADSLDIHLDKVPLKYPGLSPKEIAISESQERMAVLIAKEDEEKFMALCNEEDVEATRVAEVSDSGFMTMYYGDRLIAKISRDFINTSGVTQRQEILVENQEDTSYFDKKPNDLEAIYENLDNPNYLSQKNLIGKFDFTAGSNNILAPLGGKNQLSPIQAMVSRVPVEKGISETCSIMSYGYDPYLSIENQFLGGYYAVIESLTKLAVVGANPFKSNLSFQEFFESLGQDSKRWAKPLRSLLGAMYACREMQVAPIGGKDSMSGSFKDIDVPPTLISFAVGTEKAQHIISPELKGGHKLGLIRTPRLDDATLDHKAYKTNMLKLHEDIRMGNIVSAHALNYKGLAHGLIQMALGNEVGFTIDSQELYDVLLGSVLVEYKDERDFIELIGLSGGETMSINGERLDLKKFKEKYLGGLSEVYPDYDEYKGKIGENKDVKPRKLKSQKPVDKVRVLIPIFAGTTGEDDLYNSLVDLGADPKKFVFKNLLVDDMTESLKALAKEIRQAQILIIPSGMTYANEPNGPGKYIANVLRDLNVKLAINDLLLENDGLILGIQDGFQALVDSGLLPFGEIRYNDQVSFVRNPSGRYQSQEVITIAKTNNSPWLKYIDMDKEYRSILSNAYGRILVDKKFYKELSENEQIAFVYQDNVVSSDYSIEGLISPDGKILGKMTNFERVRKDNLINLPQAELQYILRAGLDYFRE